MRRTIVAIAIAGVAVFGLTACGSSGMTPQEMREIAKARDTCRDLGGRFNQWEADFGPRWRCDFGDGDE